ncbi:epoxide hydrolase A-like isoform X2 [Rhodamnia argentea]|uniref:Epoxide hydrolase A-like isoform X2 n=1 Tax=Rhodamnia argentea TaxID=178133 RepID=A0ABM3HMY1_9MYRT|nr:epoxide hydrolase A-like isoform X2 [Rhodamnia argentea]
MENIQHRTVRTNGINMHVAWVGDGPDTVLFIHGFPELWYSWRHQLVSLAALDYRAVAPDLRGYGGTVAPPSAASYTAFHVVGDLVGMLDALGIGRAFVVGHDWGAVIAWYLCLLRPDRVKALVNTSVPWYPGGTWFPCDPEKKPVESIRAMHGDDYYVCRFQEPGEMEEDFAKADTAKLIQLFLTSRDPGPPIVPKDLGFSGMTKLFEQHQIELPSWLTEDDVSFYATEFSRTGFTGALNYYRCLDLNWELLAPWAGARVEVPVKFIVGDQDLAYHIPGVKEYIHGGGFKQAVPNLEEVVVMEGAAHFIQQEKAQEITSHIHDFIKKFSSP